MNNNEKQYSDYDYQKYVRQRTVKKVKLLMAVGVAFMVLFGIVIFAAIKKGGLNNLAEGDGNTVQNTVKNIGTSLTGDNENKPDYSGPMEFPVAPQETLKEGSNITANSYVVFETGGKEYDSTIKVNGYITFKSLNQSPISLKFSDGRNLSLREFEEEKLLFPNTGVITYEDTLDTSALKYTGRITVIQ